MNRSWRLAVAAAFVLAMATAATGQDQPQGSTAPPSPPPAQQAPPAVELPHPVSVVGGDLVRPGEAPYQMEIALRDTVPPHWLHARGMTTAKTTMDDHQCGGTLIAPDWVLTAKHCFEIDPKDPRQLASYVVRGGWVRLDGGDGISPAPELMQFDIDQIVFHPGFRGGSNFTPPLHDLALVHLATPAPIDPPGVSPRERRFAVIDLPTKPMPQKTAYVGELLALGWGATEEATATGQVQREALQMTTNRVLQPMSPYLEKVALAQYGSADCLRRIGAQTALAARAMNTTAPRLRLDGSLMCAGARDDSGAPKATCQGDSGGPIVKTFGGPDGNEPELVAVVGWAVGCGAAPGVYTRVYEHLAWIRQTIAEGAAERGAHPRQ